MKKSHRFDAEDIIRAVEETRDHLRGVRKVALRQTEVPCLPPVDEIRPKQIAALRKRLNVSQPMFARLLNVPLITAVSWEKGRRQPSGAALRLLQVAGRNPEVLMPSRTV